MATISDQLAADIQTAFSKYYTDLANQDQIFFGAGDVTLTKPDGKTAKVRSWASLIAQVDPVVAKAARVDKSNTFAETQTFSKGVTFAASIDVKGNATVGQLAAGNIELTHKTPYIDFHYDNSTSDYTHRIIAYGPNELTFAGCGAKVEKNLQVIGYSDFFTQARCMDVGGFLGMASSDPSGGNGSTVGAPRFHSRFPGRGADSNGTAGASLWYEEYVGNYHYLSIAVSGYTSPLQFWHFRNSGAIWNNSRGDVAWQGTSDRNYKDDIEPTDGSTSLANICAMDLVTFIYKDDEQRRRRRGVIAQQVQEIDPCYVKVSSGTVPRAAANDPDTGGTPPEHLETIEKLVLDTNPLLMDAISAIKCLAAKVERLEAQIEGLTTTGHVNAA